MTRARRTNQRSPAFLKREDHRKLWRMIEGSVASAVDAHPDYFTEKGQALVCQSITKRVIGQIVGHAKEVHVDSRLGGSRPVSPVDGDRLFEDAGILRLLRARKQRAMENCPLHTGRQGSQRDG